MGCKTFCTKKTTELALEKRLDRNTGEFLRLYLLFKIMVSLKVM
jgi:hypothetical protein